MSQYQRDEPFVLCWSQALSQTQFQTWRRRIIFRYDFPEDGSRKDGQHLLELGALAIVEHGLAQNRLPAQVAILLQVR